MLVPALVEVVGVDLQEEEKVVVEEEAVEVVVEEEAVEVVVVAVAVFRVYYGDSFLNIGFKAASNAPFPSALYLVIVVIHSIKN